MGKVDYAMFVRIVAVVFSVSEDLNEYFRMSINNFLFIDFAARLVKTITTEVRHTTYYSFNIMLGIYFVS